MLRDKKRFVRLADPLLGRKFPPKGLYQALAVASMCLQEDVSSRPGISDVVAALSFLADPKYYPPEAETKKGAEEERRSNANVLEPDSSSPPKSDMVSEVRSSSDDEVRER
jgi:hypothetical protein